MTWNYHSNPRGRVSRKLHSLWRFTRLTQLHRTWANFEHKALVLCFSGGTFNDFIPFFFSLSSFLCAFPFAISSVGTKKAFFIKNLCHFRCCVCSRARNCLIFDDVSIELISCCRASPSNPDTRLLACCVEPRKHETGNIIKTTLIYFHNLFLYFSSNICP